MWADHDSSTVSSVIVFGLLPSGSNPPLASYSIDGAPPVAPNLPATTSCVPNQQLFNSGTLSSDPHNLTIFVNQTSSAQPYILDYLWLCMGSNSMAQSDQSDDSNHGRHGQSSIDGVIIGSVLAGVILLLVIAFSVWFYIRRRRRRGIKSSGCLLWLSYIMNLSHSCPRVHQM